MMLSSTTRHAIDLTKVLRLAHHSHSRQLFSGAAISSWGQAKDSLEYILSRHLSFQSYPSLLVPNRTLKHNWQQGTACETPWEGLCCGHPCDQICLKRRIFRANHECIRSSPQQFKQRNCTQSTLGSPNCETASDFFSEPTRYPWTPRHL